MQPIIISAIICISSGAANSQVKEAAGFRDIDMFSLSGKTSLKE
ncbi:hypothetical protein FHW36_1049 [Chitinophaga polysaccharea]|uniref:Uncharacterized protein n=1 Tax=Chitinophaga polysaccharea TaxID=1293035 RepID=A0A561PQD5_9BACT|nr:hypothetical protein [Chitinophaga polysaccharea]TWF40327.1 hypothetical protein FHW36_1049 [Chitinophaga polysaccharea]